MDLLDRIGAALIVVQKLREAIERNGNRYDGSLVPNLQSVTDVLSIPSSVLEDQLRRHPFLVVSTEDRAQLKSVIES